MQEKVMKKLDTEIVVVSAGTAGLAAAVAAAEKGAKVVVLEKASTIGGSGNMARGPFAVESRLQKQRKIMITREQAFKFHMDFTHWNVDARLLSEYINKTADTLDWLEKMGVEFDDVQAHAWNANFVWHTVKGPLEPREIPATVHIMMKIMADRAKKLGAEFYFSTPGKKIMKKGNTVVGVIAEDENGEEVQVNAKAVIIATGGMSSRMVPTVTGDGIRMAWEAGAAHTEILGDTSKNAGPGGPGGPRPPAGGGGMQEMMSMLEFQYTMRHPNLAVNLLGERFLDEEGFSSSPFSGHAVERQKDNTYFIMFDEDTKNHYVNEGLDFPPGNLIADAFYKVPNFDKEFARMLQLMPDRVFVADSLEEIPEKIGIPGDAFLKTIAEYNKACDTGRDLIFHKAARYLRPVRTPKFYIQKQQQMGAFAISASGGIKINYRTEVLNKDFEKIPGLYAAGNDANNLYGDTYILPLSGNYLGFALNSGRMAGENSADFVKQK
jgi:fumarate reductase flavoprotein subunit